ncbi:Vgr family protein [Myroides sp. NP-2]|nr:Vgr family protein [Myroides sp. NP-2]
MGKTSAYQHQIEGINGRVDTPQPLSQISNINTGNSAISNAVAILNHFIPGVNHLVDLTIVVDGKVLKNYKHFELKQSVKKHHEFTLELSHDALGVEETYQMSQAQNLLGKRILVTLNYKNIKEKPERDFYGIVTDVSFKQAHGSRGYLVLKGYSPTILLDMAPHIQSFGGLEPESLSSIVHSILKEGYERNGKYKSFIRSSKNCNLSYSCQYNETAYNYLARMAEAYGEQFFYDGEQLYFGDLPVGEEPIQLVYGRDVEDIQIRMQARHVNRQLYGYNSYTNQKLSAAGETKLDVKGTLAKVAYQKSEDIFTAPSLQLAPMKASTDQDVLQAQKGVIGSEGLHVFITSGVTTVPFLYPGCIVELDMLDPLTKQSNHFTTLMITDITHTVDTLGKYHGYFEAVDAQTGFIPRIDFNHPTVEQQIATVVSNADPQGKGRVQVQFDWQYRGQSTEWIRVMTPDAGSSDKVGSNRGFVAIPEEGDQVMISFVGNHPDRPFVMGGLFHGGIGAGGGTNNHLKTITTRSGVTIQIDDEDNEGSITIKDPSGNVWYMDGNKNITVTAPETMTLNSKNLNINVAENMTTTVTMNKTETVMMNSSERVGLMKNLNIGANYMTNVLGKMVEYIKGNLESHTEEDRVNVSNGKIMNQSTGNIEQHSAQEIQNNSGEKSKNN